MNAIKHINSQSEKLSPEAIERLTTIALISGNSNRTENEDLEKSWIVPKVGDSVIVISSGDAVVVTGLTIDYNNAPIEIAITTNMGLNFRISQIKPK